jgi:hypothetical protein
MFRSHHASDVTTNASCGSSLFHSLRRRSYFYSCCLVYIWLPSQIGINRQIILSRSNKFLSSEWSWPLSRTFFYLTKMNCSRNYRAWTNMQVSIIQLKNLLLLMQIDTPSELAGRPHRFPLVTEHPPIWPAQPHPFFTNNEVRRY